MCWTASQLLWLWMSLARGSGTSQLFCIHVPPEKSKMIKTHAFAYVLNTWRLMCCAGGDHADPRARPCTSAQPAPAAHVPCVGLCLPRPVTSESPNSIPPLHVLSVCLPRPELPLPAPALETSLHESASHQRHHAAKESRQATAPCEQHLT